MLENGWPMTVRFCSIPELLITPAPVIGSTDKKKSAGSPTVSVNALAPELNTMLLTANKERSSDTLVVFETLKVATSSCPSGIVAGVQLAALFQSVSVGS